MGEASSQNKTFKTVSIVIPIYNEADTVQDLVRLVVNATLPGGLTREIICVNDCSRDETAARLDELPALFPGTAFQIIHKPVNEGKGAALRDGFAKATGDIVIIQDADLEYDPEDYIKLLDPIIENKADVVYGSRFIGEPHRVLYYYHTLGNRFLTAFSNMFTNLNLTDMEVCYKVFGAGGAAADHDPVQPVWVRAGDHRKNCQAPATPENLRGGRGVLRAKLRGREKNHVEGRHQGDFDDYSISV